MRGSIKENRLLLKAHDAMHTCYIRILYLVRSSKQIIGNKPLIVFLLLRGARVLFEDCSRDVGSPARRAPLAWGRSFGDMLQ